MKFARRFLIVAALAGLVASCGEDLPNPGNKGAEAPLTRIPAPSGSWVETIATTPEGGFRMGNPDAPVKLVEYGSLTCHVCAEFAEAASEKLRTNYVSTGQVSWEFRPHLLFPTDPGITMLLRCQGPAAFFQLSDQLYADQDAWSGKLRDLSPDAARALDAMGPGERAAALVRATGLDQFFRVRGMPEARIASCLADAQALQDEAARTQADSQRDSITGTPTFLINGRKVENAAAWSALEPAIRAALRG